MKIGSILFFFRNDLYQREKIIDSSLTPTGKILTAMKDSNESHIEFNLRLSKAHAEQHKHHNIEPQQKNNLLNTYYLHFTVI